MINSIVRDLGGDRIIHKGDPRGIPITKLSTFTNIVLNSSNIKETLKSLKMGKTVYNRLIKQVYGELLGTYTGRSCRQALEALYDKFTCRLCEQTLERAKCSGEKNTCEPCRSTYHKQYSKEHYLHNLIILTCASL